jgi:hypothetical protein
MIDAVDRGHRGDPALCRWITARNHARGFFGYMKGIIMKYSKRITELAVVILLGTASLVPVANANTDESVQTAGGISFVSGGVGTDSTDRLSSLAKDFNLKLVFALKSGDYVSGVKVTIADAAGKMLLDTTSEGPWFLTKLPAGKFQIVATFKGNAEKRTIAVGTEKLKTIDFRWGSE